jgi:hypothetical protein
VNKYEPTPAVRARMERAYLERKQTLDQAKAAAKLHLVPAPRARAAPAPTERPDTSYDPARGRLFLNALDRFKQRQGLTPDVFERRSKR